jgi:hypothetical protein
MTKPSSMLSAVLVALAVAFGGAACAGNPSSQEAGLPNDQPSTVVSESRGATVLRTSDPIDKVSAYYINLIDTGGWQAVSRTVTGQATNLVVKKSGQGASITISSNPAGPQTLMVVAIYPTA